MKLLDAAGRLHLWLLRVLTGILSVFLVLTPVSGLWMLVFCGITAGVFAVLSGNVYSLVLALPCEQETAYRKKAYCVVCDLDSGFELWSGLLCVGAGQAGN